MSKRVHFIGIGGIGLSALARYLKKNGYEVSGSDIKESPITRRLREEGIKVNVPHSKKAITNQDIVIYSAVIKEDNEELIEARKKGALVLSRKDALPWILANKKVFAVAGAHGKSTTSAMLASVMDSTVIIGAESKQFGSNMHYKKSDYIVFEADESDESFLNSNPYVAIVTNAEPEHMEHYGYDYEKFYSAYEEFIKKAKIRVLNAEDDFLSTLNDIEAIRLYPSKDIRDIKTIIIKGEPYTSFVLKDLGTFEVWGIGEHIAIDASLAILAALNEKNLEDIKRAIKGYRGIKKRFDILEQTKDYILIDDYGHHPTEIEATIKSAREYAKLMNIKKIVAIWQPHKYSRTLDNLDRFVECFKGVDELIILPVWNVGEKEVDIDFEKHFKKYNPKFADKIKKESDKIKLLKSHKSIDEIKEGLIIGFGAGDITYQLRGAV